MSRTLSLPLLLSLTPACQFAEPADVPDCGPATAVVAHVIDGDTVELDNGERVRLLLVDTPEITGGKNECYGEEAAQFNTDLVLGREVELDYDEECSDRFDRLLAYVYVGDREVNAMLIERGYACVLHIPPNGSDRLDDFRELEDDAREAQRGMWGACTEVPCAS